MKMRKICSVLVLTAMLLSSLASCGLASPLMKAEVNPSVYPDEAIADSTAISAGLGDIRVMSLNLQNTMSSDAQLKENRYLAAVGQIQDYAPTLLGVQEDGAHWNTQLTKYLVTNGNYKRINNSKVTSEYCSIYYDASVLGTPIASGAEYLSYDGTQSSKWSLTWDEIPAEIKAALTMSLNDYKNGRTGTITYTDPDSTEDPKAKVTEKVSVLTARLMTYGVFELNGQRFLYVNTHLTHRSQNSGPAVDYPAYLQLRELARMKEWDIIHSNVTKLLEQYGDIPVVITGDLNEVPGSASYNHYAEYYDNASKLAKLRKGPDGSWNAGFSKDTTDKDGNINYNNGALLSSIKTTENQASSTLDYCFISPNDFTVEQFQVAENSQYITNSKGESGYVYVSDHLAIVADLAFGKDKDAPTVTLQKPGTETSKISYYDPDKALDYSWFDEACMSNPSKQYTFTLTTANQLLAFIDLRQNTLKTSYFFDNVTIKLGANMVFNQLKDGISVFTEPSDWKTSYSWKELHSDYQFKGVFDGQGHYVSGLYMTYSSSNKGMLGAIGGNAEIKNFSLVNSYLRTPTTTAEAKNTIGSIVARVAESSNVTLYNLYSDCIMEETNKTLDFTICGGLVGSVLKNSTVTFSYCTFAGSLYIEGNKAGGLLGHVNQATSNVIMSNCVNAGKITGDKYTGGLIGYAKAKSLYINNCANIGDVTGGRCSGGLIGTISQCPDLIIADCAVMANLDFSSIGAGGTEKNPVEVVAGCQVGGLIGRTYAVDGHVSGISLSGTMKGAANIKTSLDKGSNDVKTNYLASGGIVGFNSKYADDETVFTGDSFVYSHIHFDTILVSMEMIDVGSYLGGTRDTPINSKFSKISWRDVIYDEDKYEASSVASLWGARIDKDRYLDNSGETNSQLADPYAWSTSGLYTAEGLNAKTNNSGKAINYTTARAKFYTWQQVNGGVLVPTVALRDVIQSAMKTDALFVLSYQTKENAENAALTDYRFVSVMKENGLPAVGYHVTLSYLNAEGARVVREETVYCSKIYQSVNGGDQTYVASQYGGDYLFTLVIEGVPAQSEGVKDLMITVQPFAAENSGEEILFTDYYAKTYVLN